MRKRLHLPLHRSWSILLHTVSGASRSVFISFSGFSILASGFSSSQTLPDQDLRLEILPTGEKLLHWTGHPGLTYFLQASPDLQNWTWAPNIEPGINGPMSYEVDGPSAAGFYRLQYTDQAPAPGETVGSADYDGDGFTNLQEITPRPRPGGVPVGFNISANIQTNPVRKDTDGDGLDDKWEEDHGLDPTDNGSRDINNGPNGDPDGDGVNNLKEQQSGTDPKNGLDFPTELVCARRSATGGGNTATSQSPWGHYYIQTYWAPPAAESSDDGAFSIQTLKSKAEEFPFPEVPNLQAQGFYSTVGLETRVDTFCTSSRSETFQSVALSEERVWIKSPPSPLIRKFPFIKITDTRNASEGNTITPLTVTELVTLTIPANQIYSNFCDLSPTPDVAAEITRNTSCTLVPIEVVDRYNTRLSSLRVAKLSEPGAIQGQEETATIDPEWDPESRFYLRVRGGAALGGISLKVSTRDNPDGAAYDDPVTQLDLITDSTNGVDAISKPLVLVSDDVDDDCKIDGIEDNVLNDRSYRVQLGGNFCVEGISINDRSWKPIELKVPVPAKKTVNVKMVNCKYGLFSRLCWTPFEISEAKKLLKERYAQAGIKLEISDVAGNRINSDGFLEAGQYPTEVVSGVLAVPQKTRDIVDDGPATSLGEITMYLVNGLRFNASYIYNGVSIVPKYLNSGTAAYGNKILIGNKSLGYSNDFTGSHEVLHILLDAKHDDFRSEYSDGDMLWHETKKNKWVDGTKRISINQNEIILKNPLAK